MTVLKIKVDFEKHLLIYAESRSFDRKMRSVPESLFWKLFPELEKSLSFFFFFLYSSTALNKSGSYEDYEVESELRNDFILIIVSNMSNKIFEVFVTEMCLVENVKIKHIFTQHRNGEMRRTHQGLGSCGKKALKDDSDLTFLQLLATKIVLSQM